MSHRSSPHRPTFFLLGMLGLSAGCSDGSSKIHPCEDDACAELDSGSDASAIGKVARKDAGWNTTLPELPDGAALDGWVPDQDQPLQTHIQVSGGTQPCGACSVLIGQAQGGTRPYSYAWSDPSLQGPGPHQVCPLAPTSYSLTVTDSTPNVSGEFSSATQIVEDTTVLDCVADAGTASWTGCAPAGVDGDAGIALQCEGQNDDDAGVLTDQGYSNTFSTSSLLREPFVAGQMYTYNYDQIFPFRIGQSISVDVYGAMSDRPCEPLTKLFTLEHGASWHQTFCFTPDRAYDRTVARVFVNGIWFNFDLGTFGTLCKGCTSSP